MKGTEYRARRFNSVSHATNASPKTKPSLSPPNINTCMQLSFFFIVLRILNVRSTLLRKFSGHKRVF